MEILQKEQGEKEVWLSQREQKIIKKLQVMLSKQSNELRALRLTQEESQKLIEKVRNTEIEV